MIKSYNEMKAYIKKDLRALGYGKSIFPMTLSEVNGIKFFLVLLRTCEYLKNTKNYFLFIPFRVIFRRVALSLGFSIPLNVCGPGLSLPHVGPVIVNGSAIIGTNVRIHSCVVIGGTDEGAPRIGNNVYIGPGAKIYGRITIGDNVKIGANAVVNKDFDSNSIVGGVPARVIRHTLVEHNSVSSLHETE